jgi:hypothetical protein
VEVLQPPALPAHVERTVAVDDPADPAVVALRDPGVKGLLLHRRIILAARSSAHPESMAPQWKRESETGYMFAHGDQADCGPRLQRLSRSPRLRSASKTAEAIQDCPGLQDCPKASKTPEVIQDSRVLVTCGVVRI